MRHLPLLPLLALAASASAQSLRSTLASSGRLDTSVVRVVGAQTVPVRVPGMVGDVVARLYRVRVLDSNRFLPGDEFHVVTQGVYGTTEPRVGGTYLTSTFGEPSLRFRPLTDRYLPGTVPALVEAMEEKPWEIATDDPADRTVWANYLLPTREARLTARGRDGAAVVTNLLAFLAGATADEVRNALKNGLYNLSEELTRDPDDSPVRRETAFSRGVRRIAERSPLVKATVLQSVLESRGVRGADRAYGLLLLRLARERVRTWSPEDVHTPDFYGARFWQGDPRKEPPMPILPEEAVTALEGLRYPEFARAFASYAVMLTPRQTKRLRAALARMTPELRAEVRKGLQPDSRAAVDATAGKD